MSWSLVPARYWSDTPEDNDRQRRKQAEFLAWKSVDWSLIHEIGVLNLQMKTQVEGTSSDILVGRTLRWLSGENGITTSGKNQSMIEIARGNILEADAEALVNTVNCIGFMGKGIALQFKQAFPTNFKAYEAACRAGQVVPGRMFIIDNGRLINPRYIINFPTKRHWRDKSRLEDIDSGLEALIQDVSRLDIKSIAIPPLGCGLGGLDWQVVHPMIEAAFSQLPEVRVSLFEPAGAPEAKAMPVRTNRPNL